MLSFALATAQFQRPLRDSIAQAARAGAQGVQFDVRSELNSQELGATGKRQLLHYLNERGLRLGSLYFPLRHPLFSPQYLDARVEGIRAAMVFASELKSPILSLPLGGWPDADDFATLNTLTQILTDLARFGNQSGVTLCLTMRGEPVSQLQELLGGIKEGPLGIDLDPAACLLMRHSPAEDLRALHQLVRHVQIRDVIREATGLGKEVVLGRGEVEWDEFAAVLLEIDYHGWLTVTRQQSQNPEVDAANAIAYLNRLFMR